MVAYPDFMIIITAPTPGVSPWLRSRGTSLVDGIHLLPLEGSGEPGLNLSEVELVSMNRGQLTDWFQHASDALGSHFGFVLRSRAPADFLLITSKVPIDPDTLVKSAFDQGIPADLHESDFSIAVVEKLAEISKLLTETVAGDMAAQAHARVIELRDFLLALERPDSILDEESQYWIKGLVDEIRQVSTIAFEHFQALFAHPAIAPWVGVAVGKYLLS